MPKVLVSLALGNESVLPLPLIGSVIGAAVAFQFGPMFIGFGILALGGVAVSLREVRLLRQSGAIEPQ